MYTIERFYNYDDGMQIVLVLPGEYHDYWRDLCRQHGFGVPHRVVQGGAERFHSVANGLAAIDDGIDVVGIHDGVRPLVSQDTIERCYTTASTRGSAIPTGTPIESLRRILSDGTTQSVPRNEYLTVQTPQCFRRDMIQKAYRQPFSSSFTDDASVFESYGFLVTTIPGNPENIKITTPTDLILASHLLLNS